MPLRYAAPVTPPLPNVALPPRRQAAQQGGGSGGIDVNALIKKLAGGQGQTPDQLAQALSAARTGSGPTVGQSYLPVDYANAIPDDVLPEEVGMSDAELSDAIRSSQVADALGGFNWSSGV